VRVTRISRATHRVAVFQAMQETRSYQRLFEFYATGCDEIVRAPALCGRCAATFSESARLSYRASCVNTSLSGTLFFYTRWCNPNAVHFDSRVHDSDKAISLMEGNMAKKAKKAKKTAKKAKSAVKKTAKKTRKVAKKKK
jgi:hypothetical protein